MMKLVGDELTGKNAAIHAYDTMIWKVRAGFLTLVFGAWGFAIKAAIETSIPLLQLQPYLFLLSGFSVMLAIGAYMIDRNYVRRKFRVIHAVNELVELMSTESIKESDIHQQARLTALLKISGDSDDKKYESGAFNNEIRVSNIIYLLPIVIVIIVIGYYIINL